MIVSQCRKSTSWVLVIIAAANALARNRRQDISCGNADLLSPCSEMTSPTKIHDVLLVKIGLKVLYIFIFLKSLWETMSLKCRIRKFFKDPMGENKLTLLVETASKSSY